MCFLGSGHPSMTIPAIGAPPQKGFAARARSMSASRGRVAGKLLLRDKLHMTTEGHNDAALLTVQQPQTFGGRGPIGCVVIGVLAPGDRIRLPLQPAHRAPHTRDLAGSPGPKAANRSVHQVSGHPVLSHTPFQIVLGLYVNGAKVGLRIGHILEPQPRPIRRKLIGFVGPTGARVRDRAASGVIKPARGPLGYRRPNWEEPSGRCCHWRTFAAPAPSVFRC